MKLSELKLSPRVEAMLYGKGIDTVSSLIAQGECRIRGIRGMGKKAYCEIVEALNEMGLWLDTSDAAECIKKAEQLELRAQELRRRASFLAGGKP